MRKVKKPYTQGLVDGLCGFYSILNAIHLLKPNIDIKRAEQIMATMVKMNPHKFHNKFIDGIDGDTLKQVLTYTLQNEKDMKKMSYSISFENDFFMDAYEYLSCLQSKLKRNSCAIISIAHPVYHWSVIEKIDMKREEIICFDSFYSKFKMPFSKVDIKPKRNKWELITDETIILSSN
jgi:hypothetical protein